VSSSEAVSCYIPPSSEEEAMEQFRSSPSPVSCSWEIRLKELATYKEQNNGSTNVPQRYSSNEPLGNWVTRQRQQYKLFTTTGKGSMTDERIKSLNELDFEWSINRRIVENITMSTFAVKRELKDRRNPLIKIFNKGQKYFPDTHS
jgi:hypothetical protein